MDEDILDRLIREAEAEGSTKPDAEVTPPAPSPVPTSDAIGGSSLAGNFTAGGGTLAGLLANPAVLSVLPTLLGGMGGKSNGAVADKKPDRHTALLCAIKPYLGRERQQTADQLIGLCRLWDTLQSTGLTRMLPALLGGSTSGGAVSVGGDADHAPPKEG